MLLPASPGRPVRGQPAGSLCTAPRGQILASDPSTREAGAGAQGPSGSAVTIGMAHGRVAHGGESGKCRETSGEQVLVTCFSTTL